MGIEQRGTAIEAGKVDMSGIEGEDLLVDPPRPRVSAADRSSRRPHHLDSAGLGNRGVGHRLTQKERILFEAAKRQGFLKIPVSGIRKNVINIYRLWCQASDREFTTR